jgi:hypothetical protein
LHRQTKNELAKVNSQSGVKRGAVSDRLEKQGCQMVYFQTKNTNFGNFSRALLWNMLVCFMDIWSNLQPFGLFYSHLVYFTAIWSFSLFYCHLVYFVAIWYIFPVLECCTKKSGNPGFLQAR